MLKYRSQVLSSVSAAAGIAVNERRLRNRVFPLFVTAISDVFAVRWSSKLLQSMRYIGETISREPCHVAGMCQDGNSAGATPNLGFAGFNELAKPSDFYSLLRCMYGIIAALMD